MNLVFRQMGVKLFLQIQTANYSFAMLMAAMKPSYPKMVKSVLHRHGQRIVKKYFFRQLVEAIQIQMATLYKISG